MQVRVHDGRKCPPSAQMRYRRAHDRIRTPPGHHQVDPGLPAQRRGHRRAHRRAHRRDPRAPHHRGVLHRRGAPAPEGRAPRSQLRPRGHPADHAGAAPERAGRHSDPPGEVVEKEGLTSENPGPEGRGFLGLDNYHRSR
ncbi:hypothetical protein TPA2_gp08 [Tsukamurella phage TPA2]|uniref:hypothetical protein n=1 Tax=Tsukamurella phage TPA2 TaxID=981330 RepID=UPI0001FF8D9F|nr:hypothetical protein TPA2_gp08 [Tsukamurella phage TPA2]ADX31922.1 hypothetical protein [Tsukamurella phage TPA2]